MFVFLCCWRLNTWTLQAAPINPSLCFWRCLWYLASLRLRVKVIGVFTAGVNHDNKHLLVILAGCVPHVPPQHWALMQPLVPWLFIGLQKAAILFESVSFWKRFWVNPQWDLCSPQLGGCISCLRHLFIPLRCDPTSGTTLYRCVTQWGFSSAPLVNHIERFAFCHRGGGSRFSAKTLKDFEDQSHELELHHQPAHDRVDQWHVAVTGQLCLPSGEKWLQWWCL